MTTATSELFSSRPMRPADTTSPLLSVLSVILGVQLRETLAAQSPSQTDGGEAWGM